MSQYTPNPHEQYYGAGRPPSVSRRRRWWLGGVAAVVAAGLIGAIALIVAQPRTTEGAVEIPPALWERLGVPADTETRPTVDLPNEEPPGELVVETVVEGEGKAVAEGDTVVTRYSMWLWSTGEEYDSSWERGAPFAVDPVGSGMVIKAWDEGLVGAKPGERRLIVAPPDKAYGDRGFGDGTEGETLVFAVDVLEVS
ncbi:FKBP-type peptidyl-prolyl cis-trans isomerase [Salininema proteolyticum]|uniref:Peptidyl-prolyl cis-trans isomerase n=1 Tax=Salininema proteolyticum TaxID=1607685 RepID=A0ABV8U0J1_9ACTN